MAGLKYWLWLSTRRGLGTLGTVRLLDHFGTPERIYYADPEAFSQVEDLPFKSLHELKDRDLRQVDRILADCDRLGLRILTLQDADYPQRLVNIPDPPAVLYVKGKLPVFDEEVAIGVVGSRKPTGYGVEMAARLGYELTRGGALVVSGIARGLDAAALDGALRAGGGVVSVLGGGTDVYYPYENRGLYEDVAARGALISEYPPGTKNYGYHFPVRNRIISGLSLGVVAVECEEHSGTMSTMNRAWEQDRDLFAVPGPVNAPMSQGTNHLIQQGAKLVRCGNDILMEYRHLYPTKLSAYPEPDTVVEKLRLEDVVQRQQPVKAPEPQSAHTCERQDKRRLIPRQEERTQFTDDELAILRALGDKTRGADELVEMTQIPVRRVTSALTMLQVSAAVEEGPGRRYTACVRFED